MTKKKSGPAKPPQPAKKPAPPVKKSNTKLWLIVGAVAVVAVVGLVVAVANGGSGSGGGVSAAEKKYLGRLLPAGFQEASVAQFAPYTSSVGMTPVTAADEGGNLTLKLDDVTSKKIVSFEYAKPGGQPIPLLAYVKPSGKLFVGVNFCPPCQGKGQRIEADGTLTCETCGTKRNPESQAGISGACKLYPLDELPATVAGGKITIAKSAIDGWTAQPLDRPIGQ
jgi:hypothetical protein